MKIMEPKEKSDERDREEGGADFFLPEAKQKKDGVDLRRVEEATCGGSETGEKLEARPEK